MGLVRSLLFAALFYSGTLLWVLAGIVAIAVRTRARRSPSC